VQAVAGKTRRTIECLLIKHSLIRQNLRGLGKIVFAGLLSGCPVGMNAVGRELFSGIHFGMDDWGNTACQKAILPDN
jgi:hypothetical protein